MEAALRAQIGLKCSKGSRQARQRQSALQAVLPKAARRSLSRLSHVVARLEKRGWVTRRVCPDDRRATQAVLTRSGLAKVTEAAPKHVRAVRDLVVETITPAQLRLMGSAGASIGQRIEEWTGTRLAGGGRS